MKTFALLAVVAGLAFPLAGCGAEGTSPATPTRTGWSTLPAAPAKIDIGLTAAWTGKELIVSGINAAAAYNPTSGDWRQVAKPPRTANYCRRDAAWTGHELLVWGCGQLAYDPASNSWRRLPHAPTGEGIAVWTGRELIGWGGGCCGDAWAGGSAYDPGMDSWRRLSRSPLVPTQEPIGAWTGRELLLVVSGIQAVDGKPAPVSQARAAAYDPATDTWRRLAAPPLTGFRSGHAAAWDGRKLIVLGAGANGRVTLAYRPDTNRWTVLAPSPSQLSNAQAFWTGSRLLVWGGAESARALSYNPQTNRWMVLPRPLLGGTGQVAAWTGDRLLVWSGSGGAALNPSRERNAR